MGRTWLSGRASTERYAVLAEGCHPVGPPAPDPGEYCQPLLLDRPALLAHLRTGDLTDLDIAYMCLEQLNQGLPRTPITVDDRAFDRLAD